MRANEHEPQNARELISDFIKDSRAPFNPIFFNRNEDNIVKEDRNSAIEVNLSEVRSNPYQPRKFFDDDALEELAQSIKEYGVVEPVILNTLKPSTTPSSSALMHKS